MPRNRRPKPICTIRRGEACGKSLGTPTALARRVIERGSRRTPVATAESPRATDKNRGITKKSPACSVNWKKNAVSPPWRRGTLSMCGSSSAAWWCCSRLFSHSAKRTRMTPPPEQQPDHGGHPEPVRCVRLGLHEAPGARADDAVDDRAEAGGGKQRAHRVEADAGNCRRVGHPPGEAEDAEHEDHLADEDPAPAGVGGEQPADQRADRHGDSARRGHEPVGTRAFGSSEVRRHQRHHGRHDQRGTESFQDRPTEDEDREGLGQRGGGRATPVDDAPDHEGALAPDDLADLAARDHERRHDERVERDGELDPGDRGPYVLGHGGDGDVHDRAVQGHEELGRRQRQQDDLPARGGWAVDSPVSVTVQCGPQEQPGGHPMNWRDRMGQARLVGMRGFEPRTSCSQSRRAASCATSR